MATFAISVLSGLTDSRNISVDRDTVKRSLIPAPPPNSAWPVPDCVIFGQPPTYFDFSIATPQLPSYLKEGSDITAGAAAEFTEKKKIKHYERATGVGRPISDGHMVPLIMESGGRMGEHLRAWIRKCAQRKVGQAAGDKLNRDAAHVLLHYRQLMSMTLQKLEADTIIEAGSYAFARFAVPDRGDPSSKASRDRGRFPVLIDGSDFITSTL
jgi:hypothetical protein